LIYHKFMELIIGAFNIILYRPLFNILVLFYEYLPGKSFGLAIIVLTILIKLVFYPLGVKAIKSQKSLSELQPKIKEIQEKYKNDKEQQTKEMMALYKKEKLNPFSGCLPLLIQLPVLIALYRIFWRGLAEEQMVFLYSFVPRPEIINTVFLKTIDLSKAVFIEIEGVRHYLWGNIILIILVGLTQFLQTKLAGPKLKSSKNKNSNFSDQLQKQMQYFMPFFIVLFLLKLPAAIGLYWFITTLFTILQQYVILKKKNEPRKLAEN